MPLLQKWNVGSHIGFHNNIFDTYKSAVCHGMYSCQFFLGNPKSFTRTTPDINDILQTQKILEHFPMNLFTHFPYVSNLAGSKDILAWKNNVEQDKKTEFLIKNLEHELTVMANFNEQKECISGVVIHPGNYTDRNLGLKAISKSINKIKMPTKGLLLLENSAGQGTSLATTFEEINHIIERVDKKENIGVCIDTAHICGYGSYDLRLNQEVDRLFNDFDSTIGLEYFKLLHLNDSEVSKGSKKDRHACIGCGCIWGENTKSLVYLLDKCKYHNICSVLETSPSDLTTLATLPIS